PVPPLCVVEVRVHHHDQRADLDIAADRHGVVTRDRSAESDGDVVADLQAPFRGGNEMRLHRPGTQPEPVADPNPAEALDVGTPDQLRPLAYLAAPAEVQAPQKQGESGAARAVG